MLPDSLQTIYVTNPSLGPAGDMPKFTGKTVKDLADYLQFVGASFSIKNDGTAIDSASISVSETKKKLKPLAKESYEYLQDFDFTEDELRALVAENNTSEEALVLLMLTMKECEGNISTGRFSPPKPGDKTKPTESSFFREAAACAWQAIGMDIVEELTEEIIKTGFKNLSKRVLIKIFKKVVSRYCSNVIGMALAAYDWADCMNYI